MARLVAVRLATDQRVVADGACGPDIDLLGERAVSVPPRFTLSALDARVLRATDPLREPHRRAHRDDAGLL